MSTTAWQTVDDFARLEGALTDAKIERLLYSRFTEAEGTAGFNELRFIVQRPDGSRACIEFYGELFPALIAVRTIALSHAAHEGQED